MTWEESRRVWNESYLRAFSQAQSGAAEITAGT